MKLFKKTLHLWYYKYFSEEMGDSKPIYWENPKMEGDKVISTPIEVYFIQHEITGDYNKQRFSDKTTKPKTKRGEFLCSLFFLPGEGIPKEKIEGQIIRGRTFFNQKEGLLFGAICELHKMGKFIRINHG